MKKHFIFITISLLFVNGLSAQQVDYSVVSVPEESGIEFTPITTVSDYVCMPLVKRGSTSINWLSNRILDISTDGKHIAYLSQRNNATNIFIKDLEKQGSSTQRTNRIAVLDFSYSPDGKHICFSEQRGNTNQIFQTDATNGYVCRQITNGNNDYSPIYSSDMQHIFFARQEAKSVSVWSYNIQNNFLSNYTTGMNPCPVYGESAFLCSRSNAEGRNEIWKINYQTGVEECIVSDSERSFTTPSLSPSGEWILFVGSSKISAGNVNFLNTDIFVCRLDGTQFTQLTYHAADDLSPTWGKGGEYIYFVSQRGSAVGAANVWKMSFNH
ncbi:MAG: PD40 domain-containing protein [Bacteroidaceae bacterium]|nr:PD40 domain-containing protein [Bacteroidaceae bacterium]